MAVGEAVSDRYYDQNTDETEKIKQSDPYKSGEGFEDDLQTIETDYSYLSPEIDRNPESAKAIIDNMDADEQLMYQILAERKGITGLLIKAKEKIGGGLEKAVDKVPDGKISRGINKISSTLSQERYKSAAKRTLGVVVLNKALQIGVRKVFETASGPAISAIAGGIGGGIWGYKRGKDQTESAGTWMAQLGILTHDQEDMVGMSDSNIVVAIGIMRNAVKEGRVRGSAQVKLEFLTKYGMMREELSSRRERIRENNEKMTPVMQAIDDALSGAEEDTSLIGQMASELPEVKKAWETITKANKAKVVSSTLKGTVVGAVSGGVIGFVFEHGAHGAIEWIKDHFGGHGAEHALEAKKEALLNSSSIQGEIAQHNLNMEATTQLQEGVMEGNIDASTLSDSQKEALKHLMSMAENHGNAAGLGGHVNLEHFNSMLSSQDAHSLYDFAYNHNIDLSISVDGEQFGQYLMAHKDAFLQLPPDIQEFILSHPSIAEDMLNCASGSEEAVKRILTMVAAGAGVAAVGGIFAKSHLSQRKADKEIAGAYREMSETARKRDATSYSPTGGGGDSDSGGGSDPVPTRPEEEEEETPEPFDLGQGPTGPASNLDEEEEPQTDEEKYRPADTEFEWSQEYFKNAQENGTLKETGEALSERVTKFIQDKKLEYFFKGDKITEEEKLELAALKVALYQQGYGLGEFKISDTGGVYSAEADVIQMQFN